MRRTSSPTRRPLLTHSRILSNYLSIYFFTSLSFYLANSTCCYRDCEPIDTAVVKFVGIIIVVTSPKPAVGRRESVPADGVVVSTHVCPNNAIRRALLEIGDYARVRQCSLFFPRPFGPRRRRCTHGREKRQCATVVCVIALNWVAFRETYYAAVQFAHRGDRIYSERLSF